MGVQTISRNTIMARYRSQLPQLGGKLFLTDGGMETTLIFHEGVELPYFASFVLLETEEGIARTRRYYERYIALAKANGFGFVLETPTWRANRDWAHKLDYDAERLASINRRAVELMTTLRDEHATPGTPMVVSGNIGPRGDGYVADTAMSAREAADYHGEQIATFGDTDADYVSAFTLNYVEEAIGITQAASTANMPVVISFTVETDGRLPTGQALGDAVTEVDSVSGRKPAYYMINCAHPTHFRDALNSGDDWVQRVRGVRANASRRSHAELDAAPDLDAGDPVEFGALHGELLRMLPHLTVLGGCCGTDDRHVAHVCQACAPAAAT
jgi:S-methylmethionine-dependent homocysteine/selenocysteine methylase